MTEEKFWKLIEEKAQATNWNNLKSIEEYNQYVKELEDILQNSKEFSELMDEIEDELLDGEGDPFENELWYFVK